MSIRICIFILIAFSLQSCFVAKDYERPEFDETSNLYRTDNLPQDSVSLADVSWKQMFTDPILSGYIDEGLSNNIDIRVALQQILAAEAYVKQGKAGFLPSVSADATVTHQELSKNSQFGSFLSNTSVEQFQLSSSLSWEADIWGKIRSNKRAYEASYLKNVAVHQAVKTRLIADIASTYYQLLALDSQLRITEETIVTRENSVTTIGALKDAGQVTQVAVDQNIAQYNNAKAIYVDLKIAIFRTENQMNLLLGREPRSIDRTNLEDQQFTTELRLGVPSLLLRNRPDVIAAEYDLVQFFELTNVARSNFYPSLTISATGGFQSLTFDDWFSTNSLFANIVSGLSQPIFNQRRIRTQFEVSESQQEQSLLDFKQTLLIAGSEVSDALYSFDAESEKYQYRLNEVEALRNAERNSEELLKNGYANYLDLLTARQSALSAELNLIDTKLNQLLSVVNLYEALGGGWK